MTCPTCGTTFSLEQSPTPPFCCERCQLIDLGRWLNEGIGLPSEGESSEADVDWNEGE